MDERTREWVLRMRDRIRDGVGPDDRKREALEAAKMLAAEPHAGIFGLVKLFETWVENCGWMTEAKPYELPYSIEETDAQVAMRLKDHGKAFGREAVKAEQEYKRHAAEKRVAQARDMMLFCGLDPSDGWGVCSQQEHQRAVRMAQERRNNAG